MEELNNSVYLWKGKWTVEDVRSLTHCLFVFGDNDIKRGKKGQSIIRDEMNAVGIPTKKFPSTSPNAFYRDEEVQANSEKIRKAVDEIVPLKKKYAILVLPGDGLGTGLADLPNRAPRTYRVLLSEIERLKSLWTGK